MRFFQELLNVFGFNPGWFGSKRPNTDWGKAWWLDETAFSECSQSIGELYAKYKDELRCTKSECSSKKFHLVGGNERFRLRCAKSCCKTNYGEAAIRRMIKDLEEAARLSEEVDAVEKGVEGLGGEGYGGGKVKRKRMIVEDSDE